jgi:hypothetical protein
MDFHHLLFAGLSRRTTLQSPSTVHPALQQVAGSAIPKAIL